MDFLAQEPLMLAFRRRKYRSAVAFWKLALGAEVRGLALVVTGWLQAFTTWKKSPSPLAPAHISLPLYWASKLWHSGPYIFCRRKIVEKHFFYIGNFKTIITLCVKNVQRNL